MQIKGKYSWIKHIDFMIVDLVALLLAFFAAYYLKFGNMELTLNWKRMLSVLVLLNIVIALAATPYSGIFRRRYYQEIRTTARLVVTNALLATLLFYVFKAGEIFSREVIISTYILYFFFALVLKYIWKHLLTSNIVTLRTTKPISLFLISNTESAPDDIRNAEGGELSIYQVKGVHLIDSGSNPPTEKSSLKGNDGKSVPLIGKDYIPYILHHNISEVLVTVPPEKLDRNVYKTLIDNGVGVNLTVESVLGFQAEKRIVTNIGVCKTLSVGSFNFSPGQLFYLTVKRFIDILSGLVGLVILLPITAGVKLTNLLSGDTANVFYRQTRVGKDGKLIKIWKFRSMVPNADEILKELLKDETYRKEWEENQKFENDPRITKAGHVLRKTSIDELPQLLNVLAGDMSVVGPRPLVEGELEQHGGLKIYQKVKPGITGWWGCNGRSNIDYRERLELEYYYVRHCSLYLDFLCILRTFVAVVRKDGAK